MSLSSIESTIQAPGAMDSRVGAKSDGAGSLP